MVEEGSTGGNEAVRSQGEAAPHLALIRSGYRRSSLTSHIIPKSP